MDQPFPPTPVAAPAYAPPPRRRSWRGVALIAFVAFLVGLAATFYVMRNYGNWFGGSGTSTAAAPATAQPAQGGGSTFAPAAPLSASGQQTVDVDAIAARETALTGRIAELEARLGATAAAARDASGNATRAEGLLVAFAARRALDRGVGLGYVEQQLRDRFGASQGQAVATVTAAARQPVTLEDLRAGITAISPQLRTGNTTDGWWASLRREVSDLVVIRAQTAPSPRAEDRLIRAQRMLDAGSVEAALAEVERLPGAEAGDRWVAAARRYVAARRALDAIEGAAIMGQGRDPYAVAAAPVAPQPVPAAPVVP